MERLYEMWGRRNPNWEIQYQDSVFNVFCDYGRGTTRFQSDRGKIFGAGYEIFIVAFFIGLYFDRRKQLVKDTSKVKNLGQAIQYWGNQENRIGRTSYSKIRYYIFAALIAKTDVDFIALDKGELPSNRVVDDLITTMEEYANFGFEYIVEKMENSPDYFFKEAAFLRLFLQFVNPGRAVDEGGDEPEEL